MQEWLKLHKFLYYCSAGCFAFLSSDQSHRVTPDTAQKKLQYTGKNRAKCNIVTLLGKILALFLLVTKVDLYQTPITIFLFLVGSQDFHLDVPSIKYLSDVQHTPVKGAVSIILAHYKTDINISVSLSGSQFPSYDTLGRLRYSFPRRHRCRGFSASEYNTVQ